MPRGLLEGKGELEERGLAPGAAEEGHADWKSENVSGGHGHVGIAGNGSRARAAARVVITVHQVRGPGGRPRGGRPHACDYPPAVRGLPVCTAPRLRTEGTSAEIDREVRGRLDDLLVQLERRKATLQEQINKFEENKRSLVESAA